MHGDRAGCPAFWGGLSLLLACPRAPVGTHPGPQGWPGGGGGARGLSLDATRVLLGWHRGVPLPSARPGPPALAKNLHPRATRGWCRPLVASVSPNSATSWQSHRRATPLPGRPSRCPGPAWERGNRGTEPPSPEGLSGGCHLHPDPCPQPVAVPGDPSFPRALCVAPLRAGSGRERERKEQDPQHLRRLINKMEINPPAFAAKRCPRGVAFNNSNAAAERSPRQWVLINSAVM